MAPIDLQILGFGKAVKTDFQFFRFVAMNIYRKTGCR